MKNIKAKLRTFNTYYLIYVILGALILTVLCHFILNSRLEPKSYETISVFIERKELNDKNDLSKDMIERLKDEGLKKVNVYDCKDNDVSFYKNYGSISDFIILSESNVKDLKKSILDNFVSFNLLKEVNALIEVSDSEFYIYDDNKMGLNIYSTDSSITYDFTKYASFSSSAYLLINKQSYHYNVKEEKLSDLATSFLNELLLSLKD